MFGWKITAFKKSKGLSVKPVEPSKSKQDKEEFKKWKANEERKKKAEIGKYNRTLINKHLDEFQEKALKEFKKQYPQPFEIGEKVIYNYYGNSNPFSLGWYGSPAQIWHQFGDKLKTEDLNGPFKAPVHKCYVNTSWLSDQVSDHWLDYPNDRKINDYQAYEFALRKWNDVIRVKKNSSKPLFEWVVDFDWETLRFPYDDSDRVGEPVGYLNLRWGGFSSWYFINAEKELAKKQRKLWKKDLKYRKMKEEMEASLEIMKNEIEKAKNNLS